MTPETRIKLKNLLIKHEEYDALPYIDTTGHITIGIGRNLTQRGINPTEALTLLENDIIYFSTKLGSLLPYFCNLDANRQIVLVDMCFNVGVRGLLNFNKMLAACEQQDFDKAADEILDSKAASQNKERYHQLASIMRTGEYESI